MRVVSLVGYKNRELIAVLKDMLQLAESGQATGLAFVLKAGRKRHWSGLTGDYARNPEEALSAALRLKERLMSEDLEDEEESGT